MASHFDTDPAELKFILCKVARPLPDLRRENGQLRPLRRQGGLQEEGLLGEEGTKGKIKYITIQGSKLNFNSHSFCSFLQIFIFKHALFSYTFSFFKDEYLLK